MKRKKIAIVGAGIVGISSGIYLAKRGCDVTLIDKDFQGKPASYGNASWLSSPSITPVLMPGMIKKIPKLLFSKDGPDCLAVLDWELSTLGHPYADLAAVIMQWRMPVGEDGRGLAGVDRAKHGLPTDQEFIDEYCDRRGIAGIDDFGFYLAFCFFRMAGILQGVKKRALDGNAADPQRALRLGKYVDEFARQGLAAAKTV